MSPTSPSGFSCSLCDGAVASFIILLGPLMASWAFPSHLSHSTGWPKHYPPACRWAVHFLLLLQSNSPWYWELWSSYISNKLGDSGSVWPGRKMQILGFSFTLLNRPKHVYDNKLSFKAQKDALDVLRWQSRYLQSAKLWPTWEQVDATGRCWDALMGMLDLQEKSKWWLISQERGLDPVHSWLDQGRNPQSVLVGNIYNAQRYPSKWLGDVTDQETGNFIGTGSAIKADKDLCHEATLTC